MPCYAFSCDLTYDVAPRGQLSSLLNDLWRIHALLDSTTMLYVALLSFLLCSIVAASPVELVGPELSPELFKREVNSQYVFTAFTAASESNLYVYTSNDGTNFSLLKGPAYTPPTGLIRDPSVILHTECVLLCCLLVPSPDLIQQWKILHHL